MEETDEIILHSNKLIITSVYVNGYEVEKYYLDEELEFLVIKLKTTLKANSKINLGIIFEGQMLNKIVGLYSSTYTTPENEKRWVFEYMMNEVWILFVSVSMPEDMPHILLNKNCNTPITHFAPLLGKLNGNKTVLKLARYVQFSSRLT